MWKLIETAPKDGTRIIGRDMKSGAREMWWKTDLYEGSFWQDEFDSEPEPFDWIPMPEERDYETGFVAAANAALDKF